MTENGNEPQEHDKSVEILPADDEDDEWENGEIAETPCESCGLELYSWEDYCPNCGNFVSW